MSRRRTVRSLRRPGGLVAIVLVATMSQAMATTAAYESRTITLGGVNQTDTARANVDTSGSCIGVLPPAPYSDFWPHSYSPLLGQQDTLRNETDHFCSVGWGDAEMHSEVSFLHYSEIWQDGQPLSISVAGTSVAMTEPPLTSGCVFFACGPAMMARTNATYELEFSVSYPVTATMIVEVGGRTEGAGRPNGTGEVSARYELGWGEQAVLGETVVDVEGTATFLGDVVLAPNRVYWLRTTVASEACSGKLNLEFCDDSIIVFGYESGAEQTGRAEGTMQVDVMLEPFGDCDVNGTPGDDGLPGSEAGESICSYGGDDDIVAFGGDDVIDPGPGQDRVFAGAGNDEILAADGEADQIFGGPGYDVAEIDVGIDTLVDVEEER